MDNEELKELIAETRRIKLNLAAADDHRFSQLRSIEERIEVFAKYGFAGLKTSIGRKDADRLARIAAAFCREFLAVRELSLCIEMIESDFRDDKQWLDSIGKDERPPE